MCALASVLLIKLISHSLLVLHSIIDGLFLAYNKSENVFYWLPRLRSDMSADTVSSSSFIARGDILKIMQCSICNDRSACKCSISNAEKVCPF